MSGRIAFTGAILCSGCCILQLVLNFLALGCAGFSVVVEPYRMYAVPLTIASAMYLFASDNGSLPVRVCKVVFIISLALFPEMLNSYNDSNTELSSSTTSLQQLHSYHFTVPDMGCEACRYSVISSLNSIEGVTSVDVDLSTKYVKVWSEQGKSPELWSTIVNDLRKAGFEPGEESV